MSAIRTVGISPKVMATTAVSSLVSVLLEVFTFVSDNPGVIPGPKWLQGLIVALLPLVNFLAGYRAPAAPVVTTNGK